MKHFKAVLAVFLVLFVAGCSQLHAGWDELGTADSVEGVEAALVGLLRKKDRNDKNNTALHKVVLRQDAEFVDAFFDSAVKQNITPFINSLNADNKTPLHLAIDQGSSMLVEILLANGADPNKPSKDVDRPFVYAMKNASDRVKKAFLSENNILKINVGLLKKQFDQQYSKDYINGLLVAAEHQGDKYVDPLLTLLTNFHFEIVIAALTGGQLDALKYLFKKEEKLKTVKSKAMQQTVLHLAAMGGHLDIMLEVISQKDSHDKNDDTPLHLAAQNGHLNAVKLLIESGAEIEGNRAKETPWNVAGKYPNIRHYLEKKFFQELRNNFERQEDLIGLLALNKNFIKRVVNRTNKNGKTLLDLAVRGNHVEAAAALLEAGASPNNQTGSTRDFFPLWVAVRKNSQPLVKALLASTIPINVNEQDRSGQTALHVAVTNGFDDIVKLLVDHTGINISARNAFEQSPLMLAQSLEEGDKKEHIIQHLNRKSMRTAANALDASDIDDQDWDDFASSLEAALENKEDGAHQKQIEEQKKLTAQLKEKDDTEWNDFAKILEADLVKQTHEEDAWQAFEQIREQNKKVKALQDQLAAPIELPKSDDERQKIADLAKELQEIAEGDDDLDDFAKQLEDEMTEDQKKAEAWQALTAFRDIEASKKIREADTARKKIEAAKERKAKEEAELNKFEKDLEQELLAQQKKEQAWRDFDKMRKLQEKEDGAFKKLAQYLEKELENQQEEGGLERLAIKIEEDLERQQKEDEEFDQLAQNIEAELEEQQSWEALEKFKVVQKKRQEKREAARKLAQNQRAWQDLDLFLKEAKEQKKVVEKKDKAKQYFEAMDKRISERVAKLRGKVEKDYFKNLRLAISARNLDLVQNILKTQSFIDKKDTIFKQKMPYGDQLFHLAVRLEEAKIVKELLRAGAPVNGKGRKGNTPLHIAMHDDISSDILNIILGVDAADVNAQNDAGNTPLHLAAQFGSTQALDKLFDVAKEDLNMTEKNNRGDTPLLVAVHQENEDIINKLLIKDAAAQLLSSNDRFRTSPLHVAVRKSNLKIMTLLMKTAKRLDDDATLIKMVRLDIRKNKDKGIANTPMMTAIATGNMPALTLLLENGAFVKNTDQYAAMRTVAKDERMKEFVRDLISTNQIVGYIKKPEPSDRNKTTIKRLLDGNPDLIRITFDNQGNRLAHKAAEIGDVFTLKQVLKRAPGAVHATNKFGKTPLRLAVDSSNEDAVKLLIEYGADINAKKAVGGKTPLEKASGELKKTMQVASIANKLAEAEEVDDITETLKDVEKSILKDIIEYQDTKENSILHYIANAGVVDMLNALTKELKLGTKLNIELKNKYGKTPADVATEGGFESIVKMLQGLSRVKQETPPEGGLDDSTDDDEPEDDGDLKDLRNPLEQLQIKLKALSGELTTFTTEQVS